MPSNSPEGASHAREQHAAQLEAAGHQRRRLARPKARCPGQEHGVGMAASDGRDHIAPQPCRHKLRTQAAKAGDAGVGPFGHSRRPPFGEPAEIAVGAQGGDAALSRRAPWVGKFVVRVGAIPVGPPAAKRPLGGDPVDDDVEDRTQAAAACRIRQPLEGSKRIAATQPRIQAVVVGAQEQVAGRPWEERRRGDDGVEPHRRDPVEMIRPPVDRSDEQRVKVIEAGSGHASVVEPSLRRVTAEHMRVPRLSPIDNLTMGRFPLSRRPLTQSPAWTSKFVTRPVCETIGGAGIGPPRFREVRDD